MAPVIQWNVGQRILHCIHDEHAEVHCPRGHGTTRCRSGNSGRGIWNDQPSHLRIVAVRGNHDGARAVHHHLLTSVRHSDAESPLRQVQAGHSVTKQHLDPKLLHLVEKRHHHTVPRMSPRHAARDLGNLSTSSEDIPRINNDSRLANRIGSGWAELVHSAEASMRNADGVRLLKTLFEVGSTLIHDNGTATTCSAMDGQGGQEAHGAPTNDHKIGSCCIDTFFRFGVGHCAH
mmetsp:Transcript_36038/g.95690  ORF Transcript_36038/g.95690 Transcript_36038/m.95690 type:complete len:233 (+) Transcript_36038:939-1637(+)